MDRVGSLFREKTPRRVATLALFVGLLVLFRDLAVLLVFFVAFERALGAGARVIGERIRTKPKWIVLGLVALFVGAFAGGLAVGVGRGIRAIENARVALPERIAEIKSTPLYETLHAHVHDADEYVETAKHGAANALHYVVAFGHALLYGVIGLILAVIYHLEREELGRFVGAIRPQSLAGTLIRWLGYLTEAVLVTIKLQLVVAACNALLTFPVLLLLRLPHEPTLVLMIFISSLVPVVGNFVSGGILTLLAFHVHGWFGVGVFVVLTFVLHKIESYYLNPLLAARHVKLPSFVIILSLIAWEHLLGFAGLFLSFPFLFIASRIRDELRAEDVGAPPRAESANAGPAA